MNKYNFPENCIVIFESIGRCADSRRKRVWVTSFDLACNTYVEYCMSLSIVRKESIIGSPKILYHLKVSYVRLP